MAEERYLVELVESYRTINEFQKEKIQNLEKELVTLKKNMPVKDPFQDKYDWSSSEKDTPEEKLPVENKKPEFGSLSNRTRMETLGEYIARGGVTELKKTPSIPTPVVPTTQTDSPKKRPRLSKRQIFFKSHAEAESFANRYVDDFEVGKVKRTFKNKKPETRYEIKKNTVENDLFSRGFIYVLLFSMNNVEFSIIEELENLEKYRTPGKLRGAQCIRVFHEKEKEKVS